MTRIAVISDIHANIDAYRLFLHDVKKRNVDQIINLGDSIVKFYYPKEVVRAILDDCLINLLGNCDLAVINNPNFSFNRNELGYLLEEIKKFPTKEQLLISGMLINFFHATPRSLDEMFNPVFDNKGTIYETKEVKDYRQIFLPNPIENTKQVSFCGHTHQEYIAVDEIGDIITINENEFIIPHNTNAIINVGSIGESLRMKKDKNGNIQRVLNNYLCYAIVEGNLGSLSETNLKVEIIRVSYRHILRKVYFDILRRQKEEAYFPVQKEATLRLYKGLKDMGARKLEKPEYLI